ncbi:MAG: hypothetical protein HQ582_22150 [Planctomycetes bacterium]|nr:hypothetical protein [Planctomycetota bacterium]
MNPSHDYVHMDDADRCAAQHEQDEQQCAAHERTRVIEWEPFYCKTCGAWSPRFIDQVPKATECVSCDPSQRCKPRPAAGNPEPDNSHWYAAKDEQRALDTESRLAQHADRQGPGWIRN